MINKIKKLMEEDGWEEIDKEEWNNLPLDMRSFINVDDTEEWNNLPLDMRSFINVDDTVYYFRKKQPKPSVKDLYIGDVGELENGIRFLVINSQKIRDEQTIDGKAFLLLKYRDSNFWGAIADEYLDYIRQGKFKRLEKFDEVYGK